MSQQNYNWKRFWCPRSGNISLRDGGYLDDPNTKWGKACNPDLVSLEDIAEIPCLVLLGEPGVGKTHELEKLQRFTEETICEYSKVLGLNLRTFTNLKEDLFRDKTFSDWLEGHYHLHLFLDSLDEGLLNVKSLAIGLVDEFKKPKYRSHINRLHLRLTCRTLAFPSILEEALKALWEESNFAIYELAPLRRIDVINAVEAEGFSSDDFLKAINQRDIVPLAIKPISLGFLLNTYRRHNSQFPPEQKRYESYLEGCKCLCEEVSKCRHALKETGNLDIDQRLIVAARIAAVTIFANRFAVWIDVEQGQVPAEDVPRQKLCFGYEESNGREFEITQEVIQEVLDTGLFSSRGLHRMGWAHQTYAEFFAAWYLTQRNIDLSKIKTLLYSSADSTPKLIPQLHETAVWLASMRDNVFQEIIKTDPDVLLQTDIPTDSELRATIVANLLMQYEEEKLFDRGFCNVRNYAKLKHSGLAEQLKVYICDSSKKEDTRRIAIDIAIECNLSELQGDLAKLTLCPSQPISIRVNAARAISSIGDQSTRLKLKSLALNVLPEDEQDELKAYALKALWPRQLTAEELFQALTPSKRINLLGMHRYFLESELVPQLDSEDLVIALDWLKTQGVRCFGHPFEELGDAILLKAWEHVNVPGVLEGFTQVALLQWKEHQKLISHSPSLQAQFQESLLGNNQKRYALIENLVESIAEKDEDEDFYFLTSSMTEPIISSNDVDWMLEKLQDSNHEKIQRAWAKIIEEVFDRRDTKQISEIIKATQNNSILSDVFSYYFTPIELDSEEVTQLRDHYLKMKNSWNKPDLLDPPPKERVIDCLEQLESGDLSAWWRLNREMTLLPQSKRYGHNLKLDLTQLPGWKEAEQATKKRIIQGAIQYIQQQTNIDYSWIGTNTYNFSELYGCKALQLILTEAPRTLDNFSTDIWKRWTPIILSVPNSFIDSNPRKNCRKLVSLSYHHSPDEFLTTLLKLIDKENQDNNIFVIDRLEMCWDEKLENNLTEKVKDSQLKPNVFRKLLEKLIEQGAVQAKDIALSTIRNYTNSEFDSERQKALFAIKALITYSDPDSWNVIWEKITADVQFGREAFELAASCNLSGIKFDLTEKQIADLYAWLVWQYPHYEDPDHRNEVMAYIVSPRDNIAFFRNNSLSQLRDKGTIEACAELERLIQELPHLPWLKETLTYAQQNMRRETWRPFKPDKLLEFLIIPEPSNLDLSNQLSTIDKRTEKMEDEPKIINNISDSTINAPVGTSGVTSNNVTCSSPEKQKRFNWEILFGVIGIIGVIATVVGIFFNGIFNDVLKDSLNGSPSKIEQQAMPKN
ncbi:sll0178 [Synechocystis sp. PCC 6803]|uniref:Sll0178 protein n=1 Tax=Synechocystis sp. (strain ATCC 27184 / PCC 6803 / Kazusa) TaxID=1111708 RepID=Q55359_SYNY3|nr:MULTISPECIES: NACHT domain-containing NTPase [unclassified Synechocystis]BAM53965.1 hypothetical protein BEST7613_5034 [Synechocystis sp. PCC 6803] [Bacillus subtilis BEST7613]AGF52732.1 hypothetical protein MYO_125020 [Synechocystis sp. PCC 6803]ALJ68652.1 hypothetical protein AOY38_12875 [Synechocystis sp. PCC 6803]AVP90503.1 hypothetical protein C7I86_12975 [Synechocystis sp. IPPAS B-1465]MBD2616752.1 NACHT domain-containing NTPase [Synechocystis sp. FACHB-898]